MRSSDGRGSPRRGPRRSLVLLMGAASLFALAGSMPAGGQEIAGGPTGEELFGTYDLQARGLGVEGTYLIEGLIPGGAPVLDLALPETLARFASGPSGYGLASLAYPGGIIANFGSLVTQSGGPGEQVPPYPIKAEAFYPAGPTEADASQPGGITQRVITTDRAVEANASFPALDAPPLVAIGTITSASRGAIEGALGVSRTRVALGDVSILGGVITIDSLVTDLVAVHDGQTGSTAGGTVASGVKFLGLDASLTEDGLVLQQAPPVEGPGAPLGSALTGAVDPLNGIAGPLQAQLRTVLNQAVPQLDDVLARAGIHLTLLQPRDEQVDSGAATRITTGLSLTFSYKGREQQAMVDLVNSIPADLKPNFGPIPNPVTFLAENHIYGLSLAPASVSALATPPFPTFDFPDIEVPGVLDPGTPPWESSIDVPGFTTPPAALPAPTSGTTAPLSEPISAVASGAVPAVLVALALLASPLFGLGSARLADSVLAERSSTSCPGGLDRPPDPRRPL